VCEGDNEVQGAEEGQGAEEVQGAEEGQGWFGIYLLCYITHTYYFSML